MLSIKDTLYIEWIFNRLLYRFKDKKEFIIKAKDILQKVKNPQIKITDENLNKILSKYFIDFNLEKENNIGYDDKDRKTLRENIKMIMRDILQNKIPTDDKILIK